MKEPIKLNCLGTIAVTDWADANPHVVFFHTRFIDDYACGCLMVSDVSAEQFAATLTCIELGIYEWYDMPNGWRRIACSARSWLCNKGDRYLFMDY